MSILHNYIRSGNHEGIIKNITCNNYVFDEEHRTPFELMIVDYPELVPIYDELFLDTIKCFNDKDVQVYCDYLTKFFEVGTKEYGEKIDIIRTNDHMNMIERLNEMRNKNFFAGKEPLVKNVIHF